MLDGKLATHISLYGTTSPMDKNYDEYDLADTHVASPPRRKKALARARAEDGSPEAVPRRRNSSGGRPYVPQYRSGPYALILTLYQNKQSPGSVGYMTKKDLMSEAQPLAEKSFTIPDPGSRYTAWSSMGTLINKGLVNKFSNPAKYKITETGCELAEPMLTADQHMGQGGTNAYGTKGPTDEIGFTLGMGNPRVPRLPNLNGDALPGMDTYERTTSIISAPRGKTSTVSHISPRATVTLVSSDEEDLPGMYGAVNTYSGGSTGQTSSGLNQINGKYTVTMNSLHSESLHNGAYKDREKRAPPKFDFSDSSDDDLELPITSHNSGHIDLQSVEVKGAGPLNGAPQYDENSLKFWYIDEDESEVMNKDRALVTVDESIGVGFLIRAAYEDLLLSGKTYVLDTTRAGKDDDIFAYLCNDDAPQWANLPRPATVLCSPASSAFSIPQQVKSPAIQGSSQSSLSSNHLGKDHMSITTSHQVASPYSHVSKLSSQDTVSSGFSPASSLLSKHSSEGGVLSNSQKSTSSITSTVSLKSAASTSGAATAYGAKHARPMILSPMSASIKSMTDRSQSQTSDLDSQGSIATPDFSLYPGAFDVLLLVDNNEIYGTGKGKEQLLQELQKNSVPLEVRKLQVGDFCWVARSKYDPAQELVLHEVVERKRMDDLAGSIVDGRFKEQKFRLKHCGLKKPIYLVEDYGSMKHFSINEETLNQAIVNTQIIDEFYVKRTADTKESAAYLTIMTRYLQSKYLSKTLHALNKRAMDKLKASEAITASDVKLLMFDEFDRLSVKTRKLTIQEMFGKHLVQIRGITPEKAAVIVNQYPTPACLMNAYAQCSSQKEKENLLANLKVGSLQRNMGIAISKAVCFLYTRENLT